MRKLAKTVSASDRKKVLDMADEWARLADEQDLGTELRKKD
jgi:hypothetical protein